MNTDFIFLISTDDERSESSTLPGLNYEIEFYRLGERPFSSFKGESVANINIVRIHLECIKIIMYLLKKLILEKRCLRY